MSQYNQPTFVWKKWDRGITHICGETPSYTCKSALDLVVMRMNCAISFFSSLWYMVGKEGHPSTNFCWHLSTNTLLILCRKLLLFYKCTLLFSPAVSLVMSVSIAMLCKTYPWCFIVSGLALWHLPSYLIYVGQNTRAAPQSTHYSGVRFRGIPCAKKCWDPICCASIKTIQNTSETWHSYP